MTNNALAAETAFLLDGGDIHEALVGDLSMLMDHIYDMDEIYMFYTDWVSKGEVFVDEYSGQLYPKELADYEDDFIALRNAMINLYCRLDTIMGDYPRRLITHVAYSEENQTLAIFSKPTVSNY